MTEQQGRGCEQLNYNNGFHETPFLEHAKAANSLRVDFIKQTNGPNPWLTLYRPENTQANEKACADR